MKKVLIALFAAVTAPVTFAENGTLSILFTKAKVGEISYDAGAKLQYRHALSKHFAIELAHGKYGELSEDGGDYTETLTATNVGLVLSSYKSNSSNIFAKVGYSNWKVSYEDDTSDDDSDPYYGVGFNAYPQDNIVITMEYEVLDLKYVDIKSLNLGAGWRF